MAKNDEPNLKDFHTLPSMHESSVMILVCDYCGYWQLVKDVWEGDHWRSEREIPCPCSICESLEKPGMMQIVNEDEELKVIKPEE